MELLGPVRFSRSRFARDRCHAGTAIPVYVSGLLDITTPRYVPLPLGAISACFFLIRTTEALRGHARDTPETRRRTPSVLVSGR
jgi:hypothetical protein